MGCANPIAQEIVRTIPAGSPMTIPTADRLIPLIQGLVSVPNNASTSVVALNLQRRILIINNVSAANIFLTFDGTAAAATNFQLMSGQVLTIDPTNFGEMLTAEVRAFQASGAAANLAILELERTT